MATDRYVRPDWFTRSIFTPLVAWFTARGLSVYGSRVLAVRGRKSGEWRTNPVNLLEFEGQRYLVAPRGVTDWVRNIRVSRAGELRLGSRIEPIRVTEIADADKLPVLRAYLKKWSWKVGAKASAPVPPKPTCSASLRITPSSASKPDPLAA